MDYHEMTRRVRRLDFIRNEQTADAAVKAVLGILASRLNEEHARKITGKAEFLLQDRASDDQKRIQTITVAEHISQVRSQFKLTIHQARILVRNVLYFAKEASGETALAEIRKSLPADWSEAIHNA